MENNTDIIKKIDQLKKEHDAVILAHYYVPDEIQDIADYIGDSFFLSRTAESLKNRTIVYCGVKFMGESAKLLNPEKTVLMPDISADCPMAHMADVEQIEKMRKNNDDLSVVCYINSTNELKAASDVCITSANALKVISELPQKNIYMIPDKNLAQYIAHKLPDKNFIFNDGCCPVHQNISENSILRAKSEHPHAFVLAHPECSEEVLKHAYYIGSTSEIINFPAETDCDEFVIATECGVMHQLQQRYPDKKFYPAAGNQICSGMKLNTLEKIVNVLENRTNTIEVSPEIYEKASLSLKKMLTLAAK